ncbi:MAG: hypothetical protein SPL77_02295, partial [Prevotella sp.]|nr:hypothetical protein [Prevotella sp.]
NFYALIYTFLRIKTVLLPAAAMFLHEICSMPLTKMLINFRPFTVARMPSKAVSEIRGAKYARNSHSVVIS